MDSEDRDGLLRERLDSLQVISDRRNELLTEMYYLLHFKHLAEGETREVTAKSKGHRDFLQKFSIEENFDAGSIESLPDSFFNLPSPYTLPSPTAQDEEMPPAPTNIKSATPEVDGDSEDEGEDMDIANDTSSIKDELDIISSRSSPVEDIDEDIPESRTSLSQSVERTPCRRTRSRRVVHSDEEQDADDEDDGEMPNGLEERLSSDVPIKSEDDEDMDLDEGSSDVVEEQVQPLPVSRESGNMELDDAETRVEPIPSMNSANDMMLHSADTQVNTEPPITTIEPAALMLQPPSAAAAGREDQVMVPHHTSMVSPFLNEMGLPLPPISEMPMEFTRKGLTAKHLKRRLRSEKSSSGSNAEREQQSNWVPFGLNKWGIALRANPVNTLVQNPTKCFLTKDWNIVIQELRFMRALERVEALKQAGQWSFRQPKKPRSTAVQPKKHWDFLLDEMTWMRTDFREERKWKLAIAHELAHTVVEWHRAGSQAERVTQGIIPAPSARSVAMDISFDQDDDDMDVVDDDNEETAEALLGASTEDTAVEDALTEVESKNVLGNTSVESGIDGTMDTSMDQNIADQESMPLSYQPTATASAEDLAVVALKSQSKDPSFAINENPNVKALQHALFDLPETITFLDLGSFREELDLLEFDESGHKDFMEITSLSPNMQLYDFPGANPSGNPVVSTNGADASVSTDTKSRKAEKADKPEKPGKIEKDLDDYSKRVDPTLISKLYPTSIFNRTRPTLISALQPARRWKEDHWENLDDTVIATNGIPSELPMGCDLFEGRKPSPAHLGLPLAQSSRLIPMPPKNPNKRVSEIPWTADDDVALKNAIEKYPNNWRLIAEVVNSTGRSISIDRRNEWDCLERWKTKFGGIVPPQRPSTPDPNGNAVAEAVVSPTQMTTRKRLHSVSSTTSAVLTSQAPSESRKRARHSLMHDTIRKSAKRRDNQAKQQAIPKRPSNTIHDTHVEINKSAKFTPMELAKLKADRDVKLLAEREMLRRQHMELRAQQNARQTMQQQVALNAANRGQAPIPVPQIRAGQVNISQQQRLAAQISSGGVRITPQLMAQMQQAAQIQGQQQGANPIVQNPQGQGAALPIGAPHLTTPFVNRAASMSPGVPSVPSSSPPANGSQQGSPSRPPSAQQLQAGVLPQVQSGPSQHNMPAHVAQSMLRQYYNSRNPITQEQYNLYKMQQLQAQQQQQAQVQAQVQAQQPYPNSQ